MDRDKYRAEYKYIINSYRNLIENYKRDLMNDAKLRLILKKLLYSCSDKSEYDINVMVNKIFMNGQLSDVFEMDIKELRYKYKMDSNHILFVKVIRELWRRFDAEDYAERVRLDNVEAYCNAAIALLKGKKKECFGIIFMDEYKRIIDSLILSEGNANNVDVDLDKIIEESTNRKAVYIIITHNHTAGTVTPSKADIMATVNIWLAVKPAGIILKDHVIVSGSSHHSMNEFGLIDEMNNIQMWRSYDGKKIIQIKE